MIEGKSGGRSNIGYEDGEAIHASTDLIFHDKPSKGWPYDRLIEREGWRETTRCAAPLKSRGAALMSALGHLRSRRRAPRAEMWASLGCVQKFTPSAGNIRCTIAARQIRATRILSKFPSSASRTN